MNDTAQTFESYIDKERKRLTKQRDDVLAKRKTLDEQLASIDKEMEAIEAYERVKSGKPITSAKRGTGTRRSGIRQDVLALVKKHPGGITRADILSAMKAKGDKSAEQSVSNALSALKRQKAVNSKDGMYKAT